VYDQPISIWFLHKAAGDGLPSEAVVVAVTNGRHYREDMRMSQVTVGIRELKAHLSSYLHQVKSGASVVITERGKPVGRIVPIGPSLETRLQDLIEAGLAAWSGQRLSPMAPVAHTRGKQMVAELLLEDRE